MSLSVDLLPKVCRQELERRQRIRLWMSAFTVSLLTLAGAYATVVAGSGARERHKETLAEQVHLAWAQNERVQDLRSAIREIENNISRYNDIAWGIDTSIIILTIESLTPEASALTAMTLVPKVTKGGKNREESTELLIEIEGIAIDDATVADLVAGFEDHTLFQDVALDFARPEKVEEIDGRRFRVSARVDLNASYFLHTPSTRPLAEAGGQDP